MIKRFFNNFSSEDIKSALNFTICKEFYRVDIGLIISRPPIFLNYEDKELENIKLDYYIKKKYNYYNKIPGELVDFNIEDPFLLSHKKNSDNDPTHIENQSTGVKNYYSKDSKVPFLCDPYIENKESIQYASLHNVFLLIKRNGEWDFPNFHLGSNESINDGVDNYITKFNDFDIRLKYNDNKPLCVIKDDIPKNDFIRNKLFEKCMGRKIYYYQAYHFTGKIKIKKFFGEKHEWIPKYQLKDYLSENKYNRFINLLTNY